MIMRKVEQLTQGDVVVTKHPRYPAGVKFRVESFPKMVYPEDGPVCGHLEVVTTAIGLQYGPTFQFMPGDMVEVTAEKE